MNSWRMTGTWMGLLALLFCKAAWAAGTEDETSVEEPGVRADHVGPKWVTLTLGGLTTWRAYCQRPGVGSCDEYDAMPEGSRPAGDTSGFSSSSPYAGFGLGVDFFPLGSMDNLARGLGLNVAYSRSFASTTVKVQSPSGSGPEKKVISIDDAWDAQAAWRLYFGMGGEKNPLPAFVGFRGGISSRSFQVDQDAVVPLPGSSRRFPVAGLDVSIPLARIIRLEASGTWFFGPGPALDASTGSWTDAKGQGWGAEAGLAGNLYGPYGYVLKFRRMSFEDSYRAPSGSSPERGAAEESYSGLSWGLTASF